MNKFDKLLKITRANFLPASIIPFLTGMFYALKCGFSFSLSKFLFGGAAVVSAHLAGNLFNDYFDYKNGADNMDVKKSSFFGGSRVIQEGIAPPSKILSLALIFSFLGLVFGAVIIFITGNVRFLWMMFMTGLLTLGYTARPLRLAYNKLGEAVIFLLFGAGLVAGSFYLFSGVITLGSFAVSLPIAFLITSVILCNEIPDFDTDTKAGKKTLISLTGKEKGYLLCLASMLLSVAALVIDTAADILPPAGIIGIILYFPGAKAIYILRTKFDDTKELIRASRLTISMHTAVGVFIILLLLAKR